MSYTDLLYIHIFIYSQWSGDGRLVGKNRKGPRLRGGQRASITSDHIYIYTRSIYPSICPAIFHLIYIYTYVSIYLSIYLPTYLSMSISIYIYINISIDIRLYEVARTTLGKNGSLVAKNRKGPRLRVGRGGTSIGLTRSYNIHSSG